MLVTRQGADELEHCGAHIYTLLKAHHSGTLLRHIAHTHITPARIHYNLNIRPHLSSSSQQRCRWRYLREYPRPNLTPLLTPSHSTSPQLTSPHPTPPHLTSTHLTHLHTHPLLHHPSLPTLSHLTCSSSVSAGWWHSKHDGLSCFCFYFCLAARAQLGLLNWDSDDSMV